MKKLKKCAMRLMSLAAAAVTVLAIPAVGLNASAAVINYKWSYDASAPKQEDHIGIGGKNTKFSVDDKVHTDSSWFSIKLENTDYNISYVERTYDVEPHTAYKFSAMVKYSGYQLDPAAEAETSGACVGKAFSWNNSEYTASNEWTLMEYEFTTDNETTVNLALQNGIYNGKCKGTAWFSDVKLEKAELTNNWNILAVFFNNADANVTMNGTAVHHKMSLRESDIKDINTLILDKLPSTLNTLSNNKLSINSIDRYYVDDALTEKDLTPYNYQDNTQTMISGYKIDYTKSETLSKVLDKYLAQKHYNQILIFVPFEGIDGGWWGLGGTKYKNIHSAQITNSWEGAFEKGDRFQGQVVVHEICHGLESDSKKINSDKTPIFHDIVKDYPNQYPKSVDVDYFERIHKFLTCTLPDGRGVDPSVFYRPNGKYTLVDNGMTTGTGIEPGSSSALPPAPANFRAESVSDENIKFSWNIVPNADGYQFVRFKDADHKEMASNPSEYKADRSSATWGPFTKGKPYYYGIRTAAAIDGKTVYSDWTYLTYTHTGAGIVDGDVDGNGIFDIMDVLTALNLTLGNNNIDQRTLAAIGIGNKSELDIFVVLNLLEKCIS